MVKQNLFSNYTKMLGHLPLEFPKGTMTGSYKKSFQCTFRTYCGYLLQDCQALYIDKHQAISRGQAYMYNENTIQLDALIFIKQCFCLVFSGESEGTVVSPHIPHLRSRTKSDFEELLVLGAHRKSMSDKSWLSI